MNRVDKNYRKNALKEVPNEIIWLAITGCILFINIYGFLENDISIHEDLFIIIGGILISIFASWRFIKGIKILINVYNKIKNPKLNTLYSRFKNPSKLINDIEKRSIYIDDVIMLSTDYVVNLNDYENTVLLKDVLLIYKNVFKVNNMTKSWTIVLVDKYAHSFIFKYNRKFLGQCEKILEVLISRCTNAKVGCTDENFEYVNRHKEKFVPITSNDNDEEESDKVFECSECGARVGEDDKECPNCGAQFASENTTKPKPKKTKESAKSKKYNELRELKKLLDDEIITKEEFEKEKKKILK